MHAAFRPGRLPLESVQNTDPMVFGDAFVYSNCLQDSFVSLRTPSPQARSSSSGATPAQRINLHLASTRAW